MPFTFCGLHHLRRMGGGLAIKSGRSGFHTDNARPNMHERLHRAAHYSVSNQKIHNMPNDPTPNKRQAAIIADLEARLEIATEKLYWAASQNSLFRASTRNLVDTFTDNARGLGDVSYRMDRLHASFSVARSILAMPPYLPETKKTK